MISINVTICPECGGKLKHYDTVKRLVRGEGGSKKFVNVERYKCTSCCATHRALPDYIFPYKHYDSRIIDGVRKGKITPDILGFEDYPCAETMRRWSRI